MATSKVLEREKSVGPGLKAARASVKLVFAFEDRNDFLVHIVNTDDHDQIMA